ncbi:hypothetical protein ACIBCO_37585 [Streptomyces violascens]|uniref:hypothetical protein n=1 Tax=Streptomyces violascens TaxID=67381 RepID=UPI0037A1EE19
MMGRPPSRPVGPDVWATCRELIPAGSAFAFLAEHRDALFPEVMFGDMYPYVAAVVELVEDFGQCFTPSQG